MEAVDINLPVIDAGAFFAARMKGEDTGLLAANLGSKIKTACHSTGIFYLVGHNIDNLLMDKVIAESAQFFARSKEEKAQIAIENSPHFRGYGLLKNYRDWREQIHLGVDASSPASLQQTSLSAVGPAAKYWQLWGPNQWPLTRTTQFKQTMLAYFGAIEALSRTVLTLLAQALDKPSDFFTARMKDSPYLLMKSMSYLPQEPIDKRDSAATETHMGVTAHCDWSWLTFLIQDDVGGLEAQDLAGVWHQVDPLEHALVVNTGELLEIETGGYLRASPHRVINSRIDKQRYSVPMFINPALDAEIFPAANYLQDGSSRREMSAVTPGRWSCQSLSSPLESSGAHVHRVVREGGRMSTFVFGDAEFKRKAEGQWCFSQNCKNTIQIRRSP